MNYDEPTADQYVLPALLNPDLTHLVSPFLATTLSLASVFTPPFFSTFAEEVGVV